jgi:DNA polymerase V
MDGARGYRSAHSGSKNFSQRENSSSASSDFGAVDYSLHSIDLNEQLIKNKPATFFMRVSGDAMINAGISSGDLLIVDRAMNAANGKIVVAVLNGEMLVRRFEKTFNRFRLIPETDKLSTIEVDPSSCEFIVWGVVTYVIHSV